MQIVTADGEVKNFSRGTDGDLFNGLVVHLGGVGIVTKLTLDIEPTYDVRQDVCENLPMEMTEAHFDAIMGNADSVSLFTNWRAARFNQVWRKRRIDAGDSYTPESEFFGATPAAAPLHPIPGVDAQHCTRQLGVIGPWQERLPHFRMDFTPSNGEELQTEYLLPRESAGAALSALMRMRERIAPLILITEVRTVAADALWLSPNYRQDSAALHFTWKPDWPVVSILLPEIEAGAGSLRRPVRTGANFLPCLPRKSNPCIRNCRSFANYCAASIQTANSAMRFWMRNSSGFDNRPAPFS